jgi:hypothetical protein
MSNFRSLTTRASPGYKRLFKKVFCCCFGNDTSGIEGSKDRRNASARWMAEELNGGRDDFEAVVE